MNIYKKEQRTTDYNSQQLHINRNNSIGVVSLFKGISNFVWNNLKTNGETRNKNENNKKKISLDTLSNKGNCTWLQRRNLKKSESILIEVQNNSIGTNYIKEKTDYIQKNSKWRLYSDRDETINYMIRKCSKLA